MKKQLCKCMYVLSSFLVVSVTASAGDFELSSFRDVAVMHGRDDGRYDVFCVNGNREIVTDLDLHLNNVCPNETSSAPTNILSLQRRSDGQYDVVCRDLKKLVATEAEVLNGGVCNPSVPSVILQSGNFHPISGHTSYYPQIAKAVMDGSKLKEIQLSVKESGWSCQFACTGVSCKGKDSCSGYSLEVLSPTQYRYMGSSAEAVFERY